MPMPRAKSMTDGRRVSREEVQEAFSHALKRALQRDPGLAERIGRGCRVTRKTVLRWRDGWAMPGAEMLTCLRALLGRRFRAEFDAALGIADHEPAAAAAEAERAELEREVRRVARRLSNLAARAVIALDRGVDEAAAGDIADWLLMELDSLERFAARRGRRHLRGGAGRHPAAPRGRRSPAAEPGPAVAADAGDGRPHLRAVVGGRDG
jgi:hypothetical protein